MATNFMNLDLPVVETTFGPDWAQQLNDALEIVDEHDHSSGKGTKVTPAGLNINANLDFNDNKATGLYSAQFEERNSALSGAANAGSLSIYNGDLYYTNSAGTAIQLTTGSSIVSTPSDIQSINSTAITGNLVIDYTDTFVFITADSSGGALTVTLPLAANAGVGRIYIVKDVGGAANANFITIAASGLDTVDGAASIDIDSDYGSYWFVSNGVDTWAVA